MKEEIEFTPTNEEDSHDFSGTYEGQVTHHHQGFTMNYDYNSSSCIWSSLQTQNELYDELVTIDIENVGTDSLRISDPQHFYDFEFPKNDSDHYDLSRVIVSNWQAHVTDTFRMDFKPEVDSLYFFYHKDYHNKCNEYETKRTYSLKKVN